MNTREMAMAAATGVIVVSALGWTFVVHPIIDRWTAAHDRVETLRDQAKKAKDLVDRKPELEAEKTRIDHLVGASSEPLVEHPRDLAYQSFLEHLDQLSKEAGFSAADLKHVRIEAVEAYAELKFEL